jgi:hypothetical protein
MKRVFTGILIVFLLLPLITFNLRAEGVQATFSLDRLDQVEKKLYGSQTSEALLVRIKKIEKKLFGKEMKGSLIERANRITGLVLVNQPHRPSLIFTINALEWTLQQEISQGPIEERLVKLEKLLLGKDKRGSISSRIGDLINSSLPQGKIKVGEAEIPAHTLVKIEFLEKVDSKELKEGDKIDYIVVRDLLVDGKLVLAAGTKGEAIAAEVEQAEYFGREGKIKLDFNTVKLIDATRVGLNIAKKSQEKNEKMKWAVGASIIGTAVLGPAGLVTGYFVKGEEAIIEPHKKLYVETKTPVVAYGIPLEGSDSLESDKEEKDK